MDPITSHGKETSQTIETQDQSPNEQNSSVQSVMLTIRRVTEALEK